MSKQLVFVITSPKYALGIYILEFPWSKFSICISLFLRMSYVVVFFKHCTTVPIFFLLSYSSVSFKKKYRHRVEEPLVHGKKRVQFSHFGSLAVFYKSSILLTHEPKQYSLASWCLKTVYTKVFILMLIAALFIISKPWK